jgi:putative nucleotidyltransferase with HDIG domain
MSMTVERKPASIGIRTLQILLLAAVSLVSFAVLTLPFGSRRSNLTLEEGAVAPITLQAPRDIEYVSELRTEEARLAAERAVAQVYTSPDSGVARQQIERLNTTLQLITSTRDDAVIDSEQKKVDLAGLSEIRLKPESIDLILSLSSSRWEVIQSESLRVLEQIMRRAIHEDDVIAEQASVAGLVSLTLSEKQAALVGELVSAFIVPNSTYSEELTKAAQEAARNKIEPVVQTYKAGETIVPAGEIITPSDLEALNQLNMIKPGQNLEDMLGAGSLIVLLAVFVPMYFYRRKRIGVVNEPRSLLIIALVFLAFLIGARLVSDRTLVPYAYPLQAAGLLLTVLFGVETGIIISIPLCLLAAYGLSNVIDLTAFYLLTSLVGLLTLGPARRFWGFSWAALGIALSGLAVLVAYRLPFLPTDWIGILQLVGAVAFAGFASAAAALLLQYLLAQSLGLTTAMQLLEISRPDFPLQQYFLRNAPGTYQHSLQVANLAEQAAEEIGADPLLTRVGAQFHDVGKALNPTFFIENQLPGSEDRHEDLAPEETAATIIRHVTDGLQLARRHHLPNRIHDFILEHHGTLTTSYQYNQAVELAGGDASKVDIEKFRYPGRRPSSRETAILMMADAVEARARAEGLKGEDELRALVRSIINTVQKSRQLDDTQITLRDLNLITDSFVATLRGTYHPRIRYPKPSTDEFLTSPLPSKKK